MTAEDARRLPPSGGAELAEHLVGRFATVGVPRRIDTRGWLPPEVSVFVATTPHITAAGAVPGVGRHIGGAGRVWADEGRARRIAVFEAAERYSLLNPRRAGRVVTSARALGASALPLGAVARCSSAELRRPGCPVVTPDLDGDMRWTEGLELTTGSTRWVPEVMVGLGRAQTPAERFWLGVSTGAAIHQTMAEAVLNGLLEVIERDALSVAWLRKLRLPLLDPRVVAGPAAEAVSWYESRGLRLRLFDATTDLAVPTVYCVLEAPDDPRLSQVVACSTGFDLPDTVLKAVLEAGGLRNALLAARPPRRYRDFVDPTHGAAFMGHPARRPAFRFLLDELAHRPRSAPAAREFATPVDALTYVLELMAAGGHEVYVVDLTPRELASLGLFAARVVVPTLQPMSLLPLAQYRGHDRLRARHPVATGPQRVRDLNRWPQPMA